VKCDRRSPGSPCSGNVRRRYTGWTGPAQCDRHSEMINASCKPGGPPCPPVTTNGTVEAAKGLLLFLVGVMLFIALLGSIGRSSLL
jgi:hypothetical protein